MYVVCMWCVRGVYVVCTWCVCRVVCAWCVRGVYMVCNVVYVVCTYTPDWSSTIRVLPPRLTQVHWAGSILLMSTISVAVDLWDSEGPSDFREYYQYYLQNIL